MRRSLLLLTVVFSMVLCLVPSGWAQENATITGTVTDSTGAVVSNVTITLTNQATGQVRTELSNSSGTYLFANMGVGLSVPEHPLHIGPGTSVTSPLRS